MRVVVSEIVEVNEANEETNNTSLRVTYSWCRKASEPYCKMHHVCHQRSASANQDGLIVSSILDIRSEMHDMTAALSLEKLTLNSIAVAAEVRKVVQAKYAGNGLFYMYNTI